MNQPPRVLFAIRLSMIAGVTMLAVMSAVLRNRGMAALPPGASPQLLYAMAFGASTLALGALLAMRGRLEGADAARVAKLSIYAWAVGEFAAIAGIACYLLTGASGAAAPGLVVFALALRLFTIPGT